MTPRCPECYSTKTIKYGHLTTIRNRKPIRIQAYQCKKCYRRFIERLHKSKLQRRKSMKSIKPSAS